MSAFSKPCSVDRNNKGGGILIYIRERIIFKSIPVSFKSNNLEYLLAEIKLRKKKKFLVYCLNPHKSSSKDFLAAISTEIDSLSSGYENFLIIRDFNSKINEESMYKFCQKI